jgi:hypothetical protein
MATLLAACGGGGGGDGTLSPKPGQPTIEPTVDAKLDGTLALAHDLVVFQSDPAPVQVSYTAFTSTEPRTDGTGYGAYGFAKGDSAPLMGFGYRIKFAPRVLGVAQSLPGRLAFELQDQAADTAAETLRIEIDKITSSVSDTGEIAVAVASGAKVYVYAKNSAGQTATVSADATADMITQTPVAGDPGAFDMVFNVNAAVAAASAVATGTQATVLATVKDFAAPASSPFEVALTLSNVEMALGSNPATPLVGKTITVDDSGLPGVTGGGVAKGYLQVAP